jgi:GTPase SAR1 family protein
LKSGRNILFVGKKESGKTTLLSYICTRYLEADTFERARIPILLNHRRLPKCKDGVKTAIFEYLSDLKLCSELEASLEQGNCILLVDDLELRDKKGLDLLIQFIRDYNRNRYIFATDEDIFADIEVDKPPDLGVDYDKIYIHSFGRKQIRNLVSNWFQNSSVDIEAEEIPDRIMLDLSDTQ